MTDRAPAAATTQVAREQRSLFGEILYWMLAPLLLIWPMSVALTWLVAQGIANRPYDRELGDMARALAQEVTVEYTSGRAPQDAATRDGHGVGAGSEGHSAAHLAILQVEPVGARTETDIADHEWLTRV